MSLVQSITYGDLVLTDAPFLWEFGGDFGGPELVKNALAQQLQDGEIVSSTRASNRTLELTFLVEKAVSEQADAEALLVAEADKPQNTLTFDPGDGSAVTVYETFVADLIYVRNDDKELNGLREWKLSIPASPYPRSDTQITETIPAPTSSDPVTPTVTEIDACSSLTGWSADAPATTTNGTDATYGTYVGARRSYPANSVPTGHGSFLRSGLSEDMSSAPYLKVVAEPTGSATGYLLTINGTAVSPAAVDGKTAWYVAPTTVTSLEFTFGGSIPSSGGTIGINVYDVSKTDMVSAGTLTQLEVSRQFDVQGSVRTPASISVRGVDVSDGSDAALGQVLVFTTRAQGVAAPSLRTVRVDGGSDSTDTTAYSGKKSALSTTHRFQQPVTALAEAGYEIVAHVQASSTGSKTITWTAKTIMGDDTVSSVQTGTTTVSIDAANTWQMIEVAHVPLPPKLAGSAGVVEISLSSSTLTFDEGWLCDRDHGRVTILDAGDNTRCWLDAATLGNPRTLVWVGNAEDRSDAYVAGENLFAKGAHEVQPPIVNIFVASGSPAEIGLTYYPRWHTHARVIDTDDSSSS